MQSSSSFLFSALFFSTLLVLLETGFCAAKASADPLTSGAAPVHRCSWARPGETCEEAAQRNKKPEPRTIKGRRIEVTRKLELPSQESEASKHQCQADFETTYFQSDNRVKVETEIRNGACAASRGEFAIRVRTIGADGEEATQSFPEVWSRSDSNTVLLQKVYPIGAGKRLVWARVFAQATAACRCEQPDTF